MKLRKEGGVDGKGVSLHNVACFGAKSNEGFQMYNSLAHTADTRGHKFSYAGRNPFLITILSEGGDAPAPG